MLMQNAPLWRVYMTCILSGRIPRSRAETATNEIEEKSSFMHCLHGEASFKY